VCCKKYATQFYPTNIVKPVSLALGVSFIEQRLGLTHEENAGPKRESAYSFNWQKGNHAVFADEQTKMYAIPPKSETFGKG